MLVGNLAQAPQLSGCTAIFGTSSILPLNGKLNVKAMNFTFFHIFVQSHRAYEQT
jgi:hypothetical protein